MAHEMNLSSSDPGCIIFMIDQSGSMGNDWRGTGQTLAYGAAKAVNTVLAELAARCKKGEEISPRVRVGLFGYSEPSRVASVERNRRPCRAVGAVENGRGREYSSASVSRPD